jgi:hypothetical protein
MNYPYMKKIKAPFIVLGIAFLVVVCLCTSCKPKEKPLNIAVKLEITGKGYYDFDRGGKHDDYFSKLTITNNETKPVTFWMMSCSWWNQTLIFDKDSMEFSAGGCDKNIEVNVELKQGKSIVFYPVFHDNSIYRLSHGYYVDSNNVEHLPFPANSKDVRQVRIGFVPLKNESKDPYMEPSKLVSSGNVYWSNPVILKNPDNQYRIEE